MLFKFSELPLVSQKVIKRTRVSSFCFLLTLVVFPRYCVYFHLVLENVGLGW